MSRIGDDLVEAFEEMAADLRGEGERRELRDPDRPDDARAHPGASLEARQQHPRLRARFRDPGANDGSL